VTYGPLVFADCDKWPQSGGVPLGMTGVGRILRLRGTFIDCTDAELEKPKIPRAHSEPRHPSSRSTMFDFEQLYVETLEQRESSAEREERRQRAKKEWFLRRTESEVEFRMRDKLEPVSAADLQSMRLIEQDGRSAESPKERERGNRKPVHPGLSPSELQQQLMSAGSRFHGVPRSETESSLGSTGVYPTFRLQPRQSHGWSSVGSRDSLDTLKYQRSGPERSRGHASEPSWTARGAPGPRSEPSNSFRRVSHLSQQHVGSINLSEKCLAAAFGDPDRWEGGDEHGRHSLHSGGSQTQVSQVSYLNQQQIRENMEASARRMSKEWSGGARRLSSAVAAIEEIPRIVGDDMQKVASCVVDDVQSEVAAMSTAIRGAEPLSAERVVQNLEVIPTMVLNLLQARVETAKSTVRTRVNGMIQNLSAIQEESAMDHDEIVTQMEMISAEVHKIAGDAVEAAAEECRAHASRQLDYALATLRDEGGVVHGLPSEVGQDVLAHPGPGHGQSWHEWVKSAGLQSEDCRPIQHTVLDVHTGTVDPDDPPAPFDRLLNVPELWQSTVAGARDAINKERTLAFVQDKDLMPSSVTNQVVADELLRAKMKSSHNRQVENLPFPTNPGSIGHPDLCPRPCIYFSMNCCMNGADCGFCHLPHPKRPIRLDKRHREALKDMPFCDLVSSLLPALKEKASRLPNFEDILLLLDDLASCIADRKSTVLDEPVFSPGSGMVPSTGGSSGRRRRRFKQGAECENHRDNLMNKLDHSPLQGRGRQLTSSSLPSQVVPAAHDLPMFLMKPGVHSSAASSVSSECDSFRSKHKDSYKGAVQAINKAMGARPIIAMLNRIAPADADRERLLFGEVLQKFQDSLVSQDSERHVRIQA